MFLEKALIGLCIASFLSAPAFAEDRTAISDSNGAAASVGASVPGAMTLGAATFAPKGYVQFCLRRPDQCGLSAQPSAADRAALAQTIHREEWARVFQPNPNSVHAPKSAVTLSADETSQIVAQPLVYEDMPDTVAPMLTPISAVYAAPAARSPEAAPEAVNVIAFTPDAWATLNIVNQSINRRIAPMSDEQAFGWSDFWTLPLSDGGRGLGNCKHYVLEKRKALIEAGLPAAALSIAIVRTHWGETHAVLIVDTNKGELVMDNLTASIKPWRQAPYAWLSRQTPGHPLQWVAIADAR